MFWSKLRSFGSLPLRSSSHNRRIQSGRRHLKCQRLEDRTVPSTLEYSTYLGGNSIDEAFAVAVDAQQNTYVTGTTASANFPATPGALDNSINGVYDAFVAKFRANGS